MRRTLPGLVALFLMVHSGVAWAQGEATPGASPTPGPRIERYLLTTDQVPEGLEIIQEGPRTLDDVVAGFEDPDAARAQFENWGWQGNAVRAFHLPEGADADPDAIDGIYMSVHEFGSPDAAAAALDYTADAHAGGGDLEEIPGIALGDASRVLYGEMSYGDEITIYVQQGSALVRLSAASPEGDPTDEAVALMRLVLDSAAATPVSAP